MPLLGLWRRRLLRRRRRSLAAVSSDYLLRSAIEWAEHMPDTIPPNILAINAISGEHWSSRWWAMRAGNAFGMLAWWYMGAWPGPPPSAPADPERRSDPAPAACISTPSLESYWCGTARLGCRSPRGLQRRPPPILYYHATAGQTVFPAVVALDRYNHTFAFNPTHPEGLFGARQCRVRLEPAAVSLSTPSAPASPSCGPWSPITIVAFRHL